jgi:hypothetical protein
MTESVGNNENLNDFGTTVIKMHFQLSALVFTLYIFDICVLAATFDHILRGCLIPCLPRVPKKATQCVPEYCILRRRMYSVIIFILKHVTKFHFSVFTKTREKTREKQKKNKN